MDCRFVSRASIVLAAALVASTAFGQAATPSSPSRPSPPPASAAWLPPPASPVLPSPSHRPGAVEDPVFLAALQGIYESSAASMDKRFAQFSADAKALQTSHAIVLNALASTRSPDALVSCVKTQQSADNATLAASLRQDVAKAQANLGSQQQAVVGALRSAYPFDMTRPQAFAVQYMALAINTARTAQALLRANNLQ